VSGRCTVCFRGHRNVPAHARGAVFYLRIESRRLPVKRVYFIPGLGADERLFSQLNLKGIEEHYLNWIEPEDCTTMADYAARYVPMIDTSEPFYILGMSMGGMMAIELQKLIQPEKLILVSTVKTRLEISP